MNLDDKAVAVAPLLQLHGPLQPWLNHSIRKIEGSCELTKAKVILIGDTHTDVGMHQHQQLLVERLKKPGDVYLAESRSPWNIFYDKDKQMLTAGWDSLFWCVICLYGVTATHFHRIGYLFFRVACKVRERQMLRSILYWQKRLNPDQKIFVHSGSGHLGPHVQEHLKAANIPFASVFFNPVIAKKAPTNHLTTLKNCRRIIPLSTELKAFFEEFRNLTSMPKLPQLCAA